MKPVFCSLRRGPYAAQMSSFMSPCRIQPYLRMNSEITNASSPGSRICMKRIRIRAEGTDYPLCVMV